MEEFNRETMEAMCDVIESCLESGKCANGEPLDKDAFTAMYALAMGVKVDKL